MTALLAHGIHLAAASQSTVFVTMTDDGQGAGSGGTAEAGGSVSGQCFGLVVTQCQYSSAQFTVDLAGSAAGQSFFRQVRVNNSILLNSSAATYASSTNRWTWNQVVGPGSFTLRFFR